jgi:tetratricopeptide (TPR) repeat protein
MLELNEINNPFPGIRPFEMDETNLFFGRDGQSDELLKRMQRTRLLAVVGTSGSGKSSLIRAGLLPALYGGLMGDAGSSWRIAIHRPGGDPIGNLAIGLADPLVFGSESNSEIQTALIETTLRRSSIGLIDVARQARMSEHENLLVVVDQFEELFRFKQSQSGDDATTFVKLLLEASAQQEIPIYIIITMRSDFLGDCSQFTGLPEAINNGQYLIPRMSRDERQAAIVGPIAVGEGQISAPLVSRLLNDVGDNPDQLPILQHALMRTWDYWSGHRRNGAPIGLDDYTAIGTMAEALSRHADEAFNELDERHQLIAEKLFKRLTEKGADNREIRRPTSLAELCAVCEASESEVAAIIDVFRGEGRSFLMPPAGTKLSSETVIDISHESLIRNWTRLQKWVDEEAQSSRTYRRLAEATVLHREGSEGLLQDPGLQIALDWFEKNHPNSAWARRYHPEFNEAKKYLEESCEAREAAERERERQRNAELERERRQKEQAEIYAAQQRATARRLRWLSVGMAVMFVLALATAAYALVARQQAKSSELQAKSSELAAKEAQRLADDLKKVAESQRDEKAATAERLKEEKEKAEGLAASLGREQERTKVLLASAQQAENRAESEAATARLREGQARAAERLARSNAAQGQMVRDSLESLQRKDYDLARSRLGELVTSLHDTLAAPNSGLSKTDAQRLRLDLGWAHAHEGTAWFATQDFKSAKASYEESKRVLEALGPNQQNEDRGNPEPALYETYNGLGKTYQLIGLSGVAGKGDGQQIYFEEAEKLYRKALDYHQARYGQFETQLKKVEARGVAEGHLNLARLYRDMGKIDKAEEHYKALLEFDDGIPGEQPSGGRELAELYREQRRYAEAVKAYETLINKEETFQTSPEDYARHGRDIANSYSDLADVYRGWLDAKPAKPTADELTARATAAYALSVDLQRFATRLRRELATPDKSGPTDRDDLAEDVGDLYVKIGKFDRAAALYKYASEIRRNGDPEDQRDMGITFVKLGKLYRAEKDYAKAEQSYKDQVAFYQDDSQSTDYANALRDLGSLYADELSRPELAATHYRQALAVYHSLNDWYNEDIILYRLAKLYERGNQTDRRKVLEERVATLAAYYNKLVAKEPITPNTPTRLISEYLQAINVLTYFLVGSEPAAAEAAYKRAWDMRDYISTNVLIRRDEKTQEFYTAVLGDYQQLLIKQNQPELAAKVRDFRDKLNLEQERSLTQRTTQTAAAP